MASSRARRRLEDAADHDAIGQHVEIVAGSFTG
jgi:hypothetical protein